MTAERNPGLLVATDPFGIAVRELVGDDPHFVTRTGNVNWTAVAEKVGLGYDTLRKAVSGERPPSISVIEEVASGLGVKPGYFLEYRLWEMQRQFDVREVGYDQAKKNLLDWAEKNAAPRSRDKR